MTELYRRELGETSLAEAVAALSDKATEAIALVYSARRCCFARLDAAALTDAGWDQLVGDVFEARVFNNAFDLRWLQSRFDLGVRRGHAVLLHETPAFGGEPLSMITGTLPAAVSIVGAR